MFASSPTPCLFTPGAVAQAARSDVNDTPVPRDIQSLIRAQCTGGATGLEREFHGAGAIIKLGTNIRGLTTAASLLVVASIGLAAVRAAISVLSL